MFVKLMLLKKRYVACNDSYKKFVSASLMIKKIFFFMDGKRNYFCRFFFENERVSNHTSFFIISNLSSTLFEFFFIVVFVIMSNLSTYF